ncbi:MAG: site-2 protease family protein [Actinomycetota bacterium]|nr:site-2 protease family protein [Actinomycetota bacterium]
MIVVYVLIVLAAVIFLVVTHELGHFIAAKLSGVKVTEFFVGFGPRIWSTRRGETEYGVKWILVGGYVKILGMNPEEEVPREDFPRSYKGVSPGRRFWIIFSGSLAHIILALLIIFFTIWLIGIPNTEKSTSTIAEVGQYMPDSDQETPAYISGMQPGDRILTMDGEVVNDWDDVRGFIEEHPDQGITLLIERDGEEQEVDIRLAETSEGGGYLGVSPKAELERYSFTESIHETFWWFGAATYGVGYGFYRIFNWSTIKQLLGLEEPTIERPQTVVGISRMAGQFWDYGLFYFLNFFAFICLFLAYINLLPLPPLDGGHLAVLLWEKATGREVDLRKLYPIAVAVLAFFTVLFLLTLRLDITNPINLP